MSKKNVFTVFCGHSIANAKHVAWQLQSLREGFPPLDLATIKDFRASFDLSPLSAMGLSTTRPNSSPADSINTFAEWFFAGFARVTGNRIEEEDRRAVYSVSTFQAEVYVSS